MALQEHVAIVRQGEESVQAWQEKAHGAMLELNGADLRGADLNSMNLTGADFTGTNLHWANLSRSDLRNAVLAGALLREAKLDGADLSKAILVEANLRGALLQEANFCEADLSGADLSGAHARAARLSRANLTGAHLTGVDLTGVDVSGALFDSTSVGDVDLTSVKGLGRTRHTGRSTVGLDALVRSRGRIPGKFLRRCGFTPWQVLEAKLCDPSLTPHEISEIQYEVFSERMKGYSFGGVFVSYSHADCRIAERLHCHLEKKGVNVWLDRHDLVAGPLEKQIGRAIRHNDIVLLILSEASINSDWVENEVEMARAKEKEEGRNVLCPIAIDDSWKSKLGHDCDDRALWRTLTKKNILDFSKWNHRATEEPFRKLMDGLKMYYGPGAKKT